MKNLNVKKIVLSRDDKDTIEAAKKFENIEIIFQNKKGVDLQ